MRQLWHGVFVCLTALPVCGCGGNSTPGPSAAVVAGDNSVYSRYYRDCLRRDPFHDRKAREAACGCLHTYAKSNFNEAEMELMLARTSGNRSKAEEIVARPDYNEAAFKSKTSGMIRQTASCALSQIAR